MGDRFLGGTDRDQSILRAMHDERGRLDPLHEAPVFTGRDLRTEDRPGCLQEH